MQDRPTADELMGAIEDFLRGDVLPRISGRVRYHLLVALNMLGIVRRELDQESLHLRREWDGLRELDLAGNDPEDFPSALRSVNERLCAAIRAGEFDTGPRRKVLFAHLRTVVEDKLRVANPAFLERVRSPGGPNVPS
jgi:hypothetical protein